jgi:glucose 1-dehydrogenase
MLITGATSGIGRATALHCAGLGARVVAAGRSEKWGQALIDEIESAGGEATFVAADVRSDTVKFQG